MVEEISLKLQDSRRSGNGKLGLKQCILNPYSKPYSEILRVALRVYQENTASLQQNIWIRRTVPHVASRYWNIAKL